MIEGLISLASYGLGTGGVAGDLLFTLEQNGVFAYVLPFLVIFAIIFGLLSKMEMFKDNRGINVILALSVSLMALQMNFVSYFFREIFPRLGVVMGIIITVMIALGFFVDFGEDNKKTRKVFAWIFGVVLVVIVYQSFAGIWWTSGLGSNWGISYYFERYFWTTIGIVAFIGLMVWIVKAQKK
jgi:hypothetical protein